MVAPLERRRVIARLPEIVAAGCALAVGLMIVLLPDWRLTAAVEATGLPSLLSAAAPPLGLKARLLLALSGGGTMAAMVWFTWRFLPRQRAESVLSVETVADKVPVLRRADAHPDAPSRRPIRANEDLGEPLPLAGSAARPAPRRAAGEAIAVPADLDTPLALIDPEAIPAAPRAPVRAVASLAGRPQTIDAGERFETFALTPIRRKVARSETVEETVAVAPLAPVEAARAPADPVIKPASSLGALIDRLEQGSVKRESRPAASIEETLGMLRALAVR